MVPADPDLVTPGSSPGPEDEPTKARSGARRGIPFLAISIAVVGILAGSALFLSGYTMGRQVSLEPGTPASEDEAFRPFWDTYHAISDRYAGGDVDRTLVVQGAIRGMISALGDPYSAYLGSDEYRQSLLGISGQFEGIGAEIVARGSDGSDGCSPLGADCHLVVTNPFEGSPAEKAGVRVDDVVVSVDDASVEGLTVDAARDRIRGPKGSVVTLGVLRGHAPLQVAITRDVVQTKEVESRALGHGEIGYIGLSGFSDAAADQVVEALKSHLASGRTKLVLDVRGNPGGYVTAARKIASQFVPSGPVFWEQDAQGAQTPTEALGDGVATASDLRIVVLIDGGSASASEIVAGALQDTGRAQLIGQQSFGKGTVQQWQELSGEGGAFKLTIARWLTPDKRWLHQVGLTPDIVVPLPDPLPAGSDPTLERAVEVLIGPAAVTGMRAAA